MRIYTDLDLDTFEAWSGAAGTLDRIREKGKTRDLEAILEGLCPDGMDATELNDLLWFQPETVFNWLDMKTDEELEAEAEEVRELIAQAKKAATFDEFCECFSGCEHCPLEELKGDCEDELWPKWKEEADDE